MPKNFSFFWVIFFFIFKTYVIQEYMPETVREVISYKKRFVYYYCRSFGSRKNFIILGEGAL